MARIQEGSLASYAARTSTSKGRVYKEEEDFFRTAYQRDRDRIVHSTAFRRLEYKTQVFVNHEGDYFRTRLTHTLEVAQISRTVARALGANEDLAEAIALAHDIGHTPFGHSGETALNSLMQDEGGFEHNRQGLRVVELLEIRYPNFRGLNLTYEVREGIIKHGTPHDNSSCRPEIADYEPDQSPTLEAQIVEVADSIAYDNHDIDDGLKANLITFDSLSEIAIWRVVQNLISRAYGRLDERILRYQSVRHLINLLITDLISETYKVLNDKRIKTLKDVRSCPERLPRFSSEIAEMKKELESFLASALYGHHRVVRMAHKAQRFIEEIFNAYLEEPRQMAPESRRWAEEVGLKRAICDYIAGMTDRFAQEEHIRLFSPFERHLSY
jgi:dGTPase